MGAEEEGGNPVSVFVSPLLGCGSVALLMTDIKSRMIIITSEPTV